MDYDAWRMRSPDDDRAITASENVPTRLTNGGETCWHLCTSCGSRRRRFEPTYDEDENGPWEHRCERDDPQWREWCDECWGRMLYGIGAATCTALLVGRWIDVALADRWLRDNGALLFDETVEQWLRKETNQ